MKQDKAVLCFLPYKNAILYLIAVRSFYMKNSKRLFKQDKTVLCFLPYKHKCYPLSDCSNFGLHVRIARDF